MSIGPLAFGALGMQELLIILLIAVFVFGAGRIPEIAKSLGKAIKEFKNAGKEIADDVASVTEDKPDAS
jgi:sec-independent protein translocase protein TatA